MNNKNEIILYQTDNSVEVQVRLEDENVWLTQAQIAILFGTKRPAITKHLNNIYKTGELDEDSTSSILEHVGNDSRQTYQTKYYNLDAILTVGYRVNSKNAALFRKWATQVLKDYMLKGYAINQRFERIEHRVNETEKKIDFFVKTALPPYCVRAPGRLAKETMSADTGGASSSVKSGSLCIAKCSRSLSCGLIFRSSRLIPFIVIVLIGIV